MKWVMRMLGKAKKERHGFTLIELMIVLIIVAILAVAAVPTYTYFVKRAYESEASASLGAIKTAEIVYHAENNQFAITWAALGMNGDDFEQNKWFDRECFYLGGATTDFTAWAWGANGDPKVQDISAWVTSTSDIIRGPLSVAPSTEQCPAGP